MGCIKGGWYRNFLQHLGLYNLIISQIILRSKKRSEEKYDFNVGDSKRNSRSTLLAYLSLRGRLPPQFSQDLAVSLMTVYKWSLSSPFNYKFEHMYTFIKIIHQFELNLKLFKIE